jgi:hypothetical protein
MVLVLWVVVHQGMVVGFNLNPDEAVLSHAKGLGEQRLMQLRQRCCCFVAGLWTPPLKRCA